MDTPEIYKPTQTHMTMNYERKRIEKETNFKQNEVFSIANNNFRLANERKAEAEEEEEEDVRFLIPKVWFLGVVCGMLFMTIFFANTLAKNLFYFFQ